MTRDELRLIAADAGFSVIDGEILYGSGGIVKNAVANFEKFARSIESHASAKEAEKVAKFLEDRDATYAAALIRRYYLLVGATDQPGESRTDLGGRCLAQCAAWPRCPCAMDEDRT